MDAATIHRRRWVGLGVCCLSLLVIGLDNTILNVALRTLADDLGATTGQLQWIVDGYTLVFAGLLLTAGSLGDRFGRRSALSLGLVVFCTGSVLSAFATEPAHLIATRSLMGVGGALIMPATLSLLTNLFTDPKERGRAIGVWAGVSGMGIAVGPLLGGWLLEHYSWHSVFLVNIPVTLVALPAGYFLLPNSRSETPQRLDPVGAVLSIVGLVALVYAIIEAPVVGWSDPEVAGAGVVALVVLSAFVWWQLRSDHPMLDVRFFQNRRFTAASMAVTMVFFALFGSMFVITQFMQYVLGYSPLQAGVRSMPLALMMMVGAPISARVAEKVGTKAVVAFGMALVAGGLALAATATPELGYLPRIFPAQLLMGAGIAMAMAPATESIMGSLPRDKAGVGSAVNDTTRQVGGALGVAIIGSVLAGSYGPGVQDRLGPTFTSIAGAPGGGAEAAASVSDSITGAFAVAARAGGSPTAIDTEAGRQIAQAAQDAFAASMGRSLLIGAGFALLGALIALLFLPARAADPLVGEDDGGPVDAPDTALDGDADVLPVPVVTGDGGAGALAGAGGQVVD
ncbi:DHA2 family efflux MFS transporter permease subunit [Iamia majanohamensis]|uniref:DHA2 family efflux MFS transporter permease subunit n=1 Tax=Iamia majanohamensis TaxID=467976 RepID=A0AAE9Y8F3_9ACTN|nr:DHA2 family efflux MFS transporter permease subunit [Iamia majanohamensis]WCO66388.1 DHA2 family efflux MFS transporter permease subunit [Iamia majanohamensis]